MIVENIIGIVKISDVSQMIVIILYVIGCVMIFFSGKNMMMKWFIVIVVKFWVEIKVDNIIMMDLSLYKVCFIVFWISQFDIVSVMMVFVELDIVIKILVIVVFIMKKLFGVFM